ncbi:MAG TPA: hypothetical protein VJL35_06895 [Gemmatimonadaceae bacterium]|nr:hypothetical protein [Gemmatimonadaceae bacterium]
MRYQALCGLAAFTAIACTHPPQQSGLSGFTPDKTERIRVLDLYPGVTATSVAPSQLDESKRIDLILYALPNGNTTLQTIGRRMHEGLDWHYDIQNIGAQTRALRTRGMPQAIVVYLEADKRSWPAWRQSLGYPQANARIVEIVDQIRYAVGNPDDMSVTLTGHSGGGSFMFGFIEGQDSLPQWLERIAFLDANYNFEWKHGEKLVKWLRGNPRNTLVILAYDDRNIMLDGKKVVSETGGTWRASERMINYLREPFEFKMDTAGDFRRFRASQIVALLHPNPENKILHTSMIGDMNGYMHAMLVRRPSYDGGETLLKLSRAYEQWTADSVVLPAATPPDIPPRAKNAIEGRAFIEMVSRLSREEREEAIRRELFTGNMPSFLRQLSTVTVTGKGSDSAAHTVVYRVMPDYLAIGSDRDFVRMPMVPYTGQSFVDGFGFVLPTRKMVDDIWAAAETHLDPRPLTVERESPFTFLQHHDIIEDQLKGKPRGTFVAGIKKDIVITNRLLEKPNRVAIYGWHYLDGKPIQPVYTGHVDWYVDYSHGIRPVERWMIADGKRMSFEQIMADSVLRPLLTDEGEMKTLRYNRPIQ